VSSVGSFLSYANNARSHKPEVYKNHLLCPHKIMSY